MRAKEYFERVRQAEKELWLIQKKKAHWAEMVTRMSGNSEVYIRTLEKRSPTENAAVHLADLGAELEQEEREYLRVDREARELIAKIPQPRFREVLTLRYICGHSWKTVRDEMDYEGEKSVFKVHGWALLAAEKILKFSRKNEG